MSLEIKSSVQDGLNITEFNIKEEEEPSIYDLQYLVYRLDLQREYQLSDLETKVISFILSFANVSSKFYFGNKSLGRIFDKSERSISRIISSLEEKGLIETKTTMKANGGTIRFVRLCNNVYSEWTKLSTPNRQECLQNNNKINNNKNNIYICSFDNFWDRYPNKVGKKKAVSIYEKVCVSKEVEDKLMAGLEKYLRKWVAEKTDIKYIPNPCTWLNQERWEDEVVISNEGFNKNARKFEKEMAQTKQQTSNLYIEEGGQRIELSKFYESFKA